MAGEELGEVRRFGEVQAAGDRGDRLIGVREQALSLQRDAGVDDLLHRLAGGGKAGASQRLDGVAELAGVVLGTPGAGVGGLELRAETRIDLASGLRSDVVVFGEPANLQQQSAEQELEDLRRRRAVWSVELRLQLIEQMHGILIAQDLIYHATHLFLGNNDITGWQQAIDALAADGSYDTILAGHGLPAGAEIYDELRRYLADAHELLGNDGEEYKKAILQRYPSYGGPFLIDIANQFLFGAQTV